MTEKYSVNDLSTLLDKHSNTIYKYLKELAIEPIKEGNRNFYTKENKEALEQLIRTNDQPEPQKEERLIEENEENELNKVIEQTITFMLEKYENKRIAELEQLVREALEREKKLEQLLHQQQALHETTLNKPKEKQVKIEESPRPVKEQPKLIIEESTLKPKEEGTTNHWWKRTKK